MTILAAIPSGEITLAYNPKLLEVGPRQVDMEFESFIERIVTKSNNTLLI